MPSIDFSNTAIAFARYSNADLRKARLLFLLIQKSFVVRFGKGMLRVALATHFPIKWIIKPTIFKHFCGGETIQECLSTVQTLADYQVDSIPDYSAEGHDSETHFEGVKNEILNVIAASAGHSDMPYAVFKPSGIIRGGLLEKVTAGEMLQPAEEAEYERAKLRFEALCSAAVQAKLRIMVDAEQSWIQGAIDELTEAMMMKYNHDAPWVYHTVQMYRTDRLEYMKNLFSRFDEQHLYTGFKIVRGAYMERERLRAASENRPSPIYPDKAGTDKAYNDAMLLCTGRIDKTAVCLATHNEESSQMLVDRMHELGLNPKHPEVCFAQLYGMSDHITFNLAHAGYSVVKYVPYGPVKTVMPYLIRRAEENTSVAGQTGRELLNIANEVSRRKTAGMW